MIKPKLIEDDFDLFTGAFNKINFVEQDNRKSSVILPSIDIKPLDIVEPQMLGKTSLRTGSTTGSFVDTDRIPSNNEFQPTSISPVQLDKQFKNAPEENAETGILDDASIKVVKEKSDIEYKTIFKSVFIPMQIFNNNQRTINLPSIASLTKSVEPTDSTLSESNPPTNITDTTLDEMQQNFNNLEPKFDNDIVDNQKISNVDQSPNYQPADKFMTNDTMGNPSGINTAPFQPQVQPSLAPVQAVKTPITIQSIFEKYRKLNKTVTKIVHKKDGNLTQKWVYFSDGSSVLEDPGIEKEITEQPKMAPGPVANEEKYPNAEDYNIQAQTGNPNWNPQNPTGMNNSIQPSNVYFYDHSDLVAEFDPKNPNNIAITLYEITTLQQKHLYCKYFDPTPHPKFKEMASIIDFNIVANPSVYHNLDQLNDEALFGVPEVKPEEPVKYWTKTLRKSYKAISKKNKIIKKSS